MPNENPNSSIALNIVRVFLILLLLILLAISGYYFVISLDALGDDIDVYRETHLTHDKHDNHLFGITDSSKKEHHISSLIIWVVITMFAAIFAIAGIIGALCLNPCLVVFSAIMTFLFALFGIFLPDINLTLPLVSSNYYLLGLEIVTIILAVVFAVIMNKYGVQRFPKRRINFS